MKEGDPMSRKENLHQLVTTALFAAAITVMTVMAAANSAVVVSRRKFSL